MTIKARPHQPPSSPTETELYLDDTTSYVWLVAKTGTRQDALLRISDKGVERVAERSKVHCVPLDETGRVVLVNEPKAIDDVDRPIAYNYSDPRFRAAAEICELCVQETKHWLARQRKKWTRDKEHHRDEGFALGQFPVADIIAKHVGSRKVYSDSSPSLEEVERLRAFFEAARPLVEYCRKRVNERKPLGCGYSDPPNGLTDEHVDDAIAAFDAVQGGEK